MKWKMMEEWRKVGKSGNQEIGNNKRLFEERRINLKHKKRNRV